MSENNSPTAAEPETEVPPIEVMYQGSCLSVSGRSTLEFAVGRHSKDATLHLAIASNSGKGMWCKDWASAVAIQEVVMGDGPLSAKSFLVLHPGKSINTGGFVLAALKELGLIRANAENTRHHEHVPATTFEKVVMACMGEGKEPVAKPSRRKTSLRI